MHSTNVGAAAGCGGIELGAGATGSGVDVVEVSAVMEAAVELSELVVSSELLVVGVLLCEVSAVVEDVGVVVSLSVVSAQLESASETVPKSTRRKWRIFMTRALSADFKRGISVARKKAHGIQQREV